MQGCLRYSKSTLNTRKVLTVFGGDAERIYAYMENMLICIFSYYAKRHKSVYISVNNNTNLNFFQILSIYTLLDGLSQNPSHATVPLKRPSSWTLRWNKFPAVLANIDEATICNAERRRIRERHGRQAFLLCQLTWKGRGSPVPTTEKRRRIL